MAAYYNENNAYAAAWLRNLIAAGHIADGEVDDRSIVDVRADDLRGFTQCHFFAGIGGWSLALRLAGWPDDRPVWTGSCPCQPFSAAGKRGGFDDARHLWPEWFRLIGECGPAKVIGEQVASKDGLVWLDLVSADLEGAGYAFGAADLCAAGIGAPHIRQRLWFVADADQGQRGRLANGEGRDPDRQAPGRIEGDGQSQPGVVVRRLADASEQGFPQRECVGGVRREAMGAHAGQADECGSDLGGLADAGLNSTRSQSRDSAETACCQEGARESEQCSALSDRRGEDAGGRGVHRGDGLSGDSIRTGSPDSPWGNPDWLLCRDGKWRPVEPGTFPLADGIPGRVGRLRAYGNAINPYVAAEFIQSYVQSVET